MAVGFLSFYVGHHPAPGHYVFPHGRILDNFITGRNQLDDRKDSAAGDEVCRVKILPYMKILFQVSSSWLESLCFPYSCPCAGPRNKRHIKDWAQSLDAWTRLYLQSSPSPGKKEKAWR